MTPRTYNDLIAALVETFISERRSAPTIKDATGKDGHINRKTADRMVDPKGYFHPKRPKGSLAESARPVDAFMRDVTALGKVWSRPSDGRRFIMLGYAGVSIEPYDARSANVMEITTVSYERGKGEASKLLRAVCELADKHGVTLYGNAYPIRRRLSDNALSQDDLVAWYERNGFERASEPATRGVNVVRKPRQP